MTFKDWRAYYKKSDWTLKWFVIVIFLRPIADSFYELKRVSSFISPIYILGVLTPILAVLSIFQNKKSRNPTSADDFMKLFAIMSFVSCAALVVFYYSLDMLGAALKYVTPPILFFYLRGVVKSKEDLMFILQTFLYSAIYPFVMMYYEIIIGPINPEYASEGRGGGARIRGEFADSMNYAIYLTGSFLIYTYFYMHELYYKVKVRRTSVPKLLMYFVFILLGIISLRHVSTWSVFLMTLSILMFYNARNLQSFIFIFILAAFIFPFIARPIYEKQIYPLIAKEFNVLSGEQDVQYAFNGRVSRWERYFAIWDNMPTYTHFVGVPFSGYKIAPIMTGGGMHNDYVRLLFLTGYIGVIAYVLVYIATLFRRRVLPIPERYLLTVAVLMILLYSVSTLPTIYPGLQYVSYAVMSYALLPHKVAKPVLRKRSLFPEQESNLPAVQ